MNQPSRVLLIVAGALTQVVGAACLILNLVSLPFAHDLHARTHSIVAAIVAALATVICGTLVYRGRLIPIALAAGLDIGFGIGLPRGSAATGTLLRVLPAADVATATTLITAAAITLFVAAILCVLAIPTALRLRAWARAEIEREALAARGAEGEKAKRASTGAIVPAAASTLRGVGPKLMPTQVIRLDPKRRKPVVIVGVAVALIAIGVVVISAASGSSSTKDTDGIVMDKHVDPATPVVDASLAVVAIPDATSPTDPPVEEVVARLHLALEHAKPDELALLFDSKVFAFGVESHEVVQGRDAVVAMLRHDLGDVPAKGFEVSARFAQNGHEGDSGWVAEELKVGAKTFVATAVVGLRDGAWSIAALHWAVAMSNEQAYRTARDATLETPDAIPDAHDDSPLAKAMRTAFASKPSFVAARSTRADAVNLGSAPGERVLGGDNIKKIFARIKATIALHDAVAVGPAGSHGGWGAANVDFTDADKDGTQVTQTFRVLVAWIEEPDGWRIVQSQWSNAR
ncbi:MAG: nuclear transport factor 2 family protein [Kofleriaceae bacterium]